MAAVEYERVLTSLYALEAAKGMDFKLERVALALKNLGNPQRRFAAVHIAGTNGKGSVAAMIHSILCAAGYRVGLYTSPHLVSFTERIRVGATSITEEAVVERASEIHTAATLCGIDLTFFEFVTVMAFLEFARCEVEVAVIEVGLGGRLDATNVLDPELAVITTIGLDHQEFLGDTITSVAREKAGIIKPGRPVIVGRVPTEAQGVFKQVAETGDAPTYWFGTDYWIHGAGPLQFEGFETRLKDLAVPLRGQHQRENAAVAVAAAVQLRRTLRISDTAIRRGLSAVRWPGRLDIVKTRPLVVLDGAHNCDGVAALVRELPALTAHRALHLLFGVMRDKQWQPMVDMIGPAASSITVTPTLPPRGEVPEVLARAFAPYGPVSVAPHPAAGLDALLESVDADDAIVVTGSLFLVGEILSALLGRRRQPGVFSATRIPSQP